MKAISWMGMTGLALVWMVGTSAAQTAVGYVKVTMEDGKTYLLTHQFLSIDGNPTTLDDVIGEQAPVGSEVLFWSGTGFVHAVYKDAEPPLFPDPRWDPDTEEISPGIGFFIRIPQETPEPAYDVYLLGEVPGANNGSETTTVNVAEGYTQTGYPYPADTAWTATVLAASATVDDQFLTWDPDSGYVPYVYKAAQPPFFPDDRWDPGDKELPPGEGFIYHKTSPGVLVWEAVKPYEWP